VKILTLIVFSLLTHLALAGELPWIGVTLNPPTPEQREGTSVKQGVGFSVDQVIAGGPLAKTGGKEKDLWWKFDGQILINKSQMVVLLRGKSPGDEVEVAYFREGQLQKLSLILEMRPRRNIIPASMVPERPSCSRILAKREQIAKITLNTKELSLENEGEKWRFTIKEGGAVVLSSLVGDQDLNDKVPAKWHGPFMILKHTLHGSGNPPGAPIKQRVRYVPDPKSPTE